MYAGKIFDGMNLSELLEMAEALSLKLQIYPSAAYTPMHNASEAQKDVCAWMRAAYKDEISKIEMLPEEIELAKTEEVEAVKALRARLNLPLKDAYERVKSAKLLAK